MRTNLLPGAYIIQVLNANNKKPGRKTKFINYSQQLKNKPTLSFMAPTLCFRPLFLKLGSFPLHCRNTFYLYQNCG